MKESGNGAGTSASVRGSESSSASGESHDDQLLLLSKSEVFALIDTVTSQNNVLLEWLSKEKETGRIVKIREAVSSITGALAKLSSAYLSSLTAHRTNGIICQRMNFSCERIEQSVASLVNQNPSSSDTRSYPNKVKQNSVDPPCKVSLSHGRSFAIKARKHVVIDPTANNENQFPSSKETRQALSISVNPIAMKINVQRVINSREKSVIIEGDESLNKLQNSPALEAAGLEVKANTKMNPRIIVHDIPVELGKDEILKYLVEQNIPELSVADLKAIFLYSAAQKKYRSCVIETSSAIRKTLLEKQRVFIQWSSCRLGDHVSIFQCFKCQGIGHSSEASPLLQYAQQVMVQHHALQTTVHPAHVCSAYHGAACIQHIRLCQYMSGRPRLEYPWLYSRLRILQFIAVVVPHNEFAAALLLLIAASHRSYVYPPPPLPSSSQQVLAPT
ncbi:hypothetical protein QAD02_002133 [Eretmocerus hayati]|uniref:Uncharacterized protein n=1 Tax=Eretmocerus hayati TaxID=131215 RepID=A0ACC2NIB6_9HYME|nr:hypothetical protein QAD02_002133 [Eretmocerus hayati]